jgi:hypothetical protein
MAEPTFRHLDEEKWQDVRAVQVEGRRALVREKWLWFSPECLSLYARWDPGMMVHKHGHQSDHVVFVIDGEMSCGDHRCTPGTHIFLPKGAVFGPFVAGPQGGVLFEVMMGDPRSFPADPEGWKKLLAEKNALQLPNPPIDMPSWIKDTRSEPPK